MATYASANDLPAELHYMIYASACMDGGETGRALSATSKSVRTLSTAYRYQSVAIAGWHQLSRFLEQLRGLPPDLRRVRHLFLCDHPYSRPVQRENMSGMVDVLRGISQSRRDDESTNHDFNFDLGDFSFLSLLEGVGNTKRETLNDILKVVSSTLVTFTLVYFSEGSHGSTTYPSTVNSFTVDSPHIPLLNHSFPCLTELTVRGPHELPSSPTFAPKLQRLHITEESLTPDFIHTVVSNHPLLTHVRLSRFLQIMSNFSMIIDFMVAMALLPKTEDYEVPQMARGIRRWFIVEPGVIIGYRSVRRGRLGETEKRLPQGHRQLTDKFTLIRRLSPTCLLLRDHLGYGKGRETHNSREEWLSRLREGPGCWLVTSNTGQCVKIS
jgi:hypothetical protein